MTLAELIPKINYALRGTDDDAPTAGIDYDYWLSVANDKIDELYRDVGQDWSQAFEARSIGTIAAGTAPTFDLDDDFLGPAQQVYILHTDGSTRTYYDIIKPQEIDQRRRTVYISGQDPEVLAFTDDILTGEQIIGGSLYLPGFWVPDDMVNAGDTVPVPNPHWLVMASAAEIAFNDLTYEDKFSDLNGKANNLYKLMTRRNRRATHGQGRVSPTNVRRITGFH